jgi:DNA polymerase-1
MNLVSKFGDMDVFLGLDHGQLEIRVLAQMSQDPLLLKLVQSGEDIHSGVGHELTGKPIEKIKHDRDTRTAVKGIHFGIIFGMTEESLYYKLKTDALESGEEFNMDKEEVARLYRAYFKKFPGVKDFMDGQIEFGKENGFVKTLFGFQREISMAGDETRTTFWENQCRNSPIQGTAHQLMLISMAVLNLKKQTYRFLQRQSMEVHDALYGFVKLKELVGAYKEAIYLLEKEVLVYVKKWWPEVNWVVPLKAEAKAGFRLGIMVEYSGGPVEEFIDQWCQKNQKEAIGV